MPLGLASAAGSRLVMATPSRPRLLPPVVAALLLAAATVIHFALPEMPRLRVLVLGIALILAGLGVMLWAARLFRRAGTTILPHGQPSRLVVSGPYRFTRNPIYLGIATVFAGIGFLVGTPPFFVAALVFPLWMNARFIPMEERNLEAALGDDYRAFRSRVRRWI